MSITEVPANVTKWTTLANRYDEDLSIYDLNLGQLQSGSKIEEKQFLALRVIWKSKEAIGFSPSDWGLNINDSIGNLDGVKDWKTYSNQVQAGLGNVPYFGRFDLLWEFQKQVHTLRHSKKGPNKILYSPAAGSSPVAGRTRNKVKGKAVAIDPDIAQSSRNPHTPPQNPTQIDDALLDVKSLDLNKPALQGTPQGTLSAYSTPANKITSKIAGLHVTPASPAFQECMGQFPAADDEQTVNTALVLLVQAVCLSVESLRKITWTLERKAFVFGTPKLFEARTDGHLRYTDQSGERSLAILEVKPGLRDNAKPRMQESSQMAAWIYSEPDIRTKDGKYKRILIAQDRHEIYLVIATYNDDYIDYLTSGNAQNKPFLIMNEFGPFDPERTGHMRLLGPCLQAFSSQLTYAADQGQPYRW